VCYPKQYQEKLGRLSRPSAQEFDMTERSRSTTSAICPVPKAIATKTAEFSAAIRDEVMASVMQARRFTVDAVTTWADVVGKLVPELPVRPFVPARSEVVKGFSTAFEVAEEVWALQRRFASDLVSCIASSTLEHAGRRLAADAARVSTS
jgi:hypothetical protein